MAGSIAGVEVVVQVITELLQLNLASYLADIEEDAQISLGLTAPDETNGYTTSLTVAGRDRYNWIAIDVMDTIELDGESWMNYSAPITEQHEIAVRWTYLARDRNYGQRRRVITRAVTKLLRESWWFYDSNRACLIDLDVRTDHTQDSLRRAEDSIPARTPGDVPTGHNLESVTVTVICKQRVENIIGRVQVAPARGGFSNGFSSGFGAPDNPFSNGFSAGFGA